MSSALRRRLEEQDDLAEVWKGLSNPIRRSMLDALRDGPLTTSELAELFPELSRFAVMQHLKVLEEGQLIIHRKSGRQRFNYLNPIPIQHVYHRWVRQYEANWAEALVSLKSELETNADARTKKGTGRGRKR
ncbi:MAG: metalloregulator ArsR/SmtB family transcription factor [Acidobacteriota bacterium]